MSESYRRVPRPTKTSSIDFEAASRNKAARQSSQAQMPTSANRWEMTPTGFPKQESPEAKKSWMEKILSFTGGNVLARAGGLALAQGGTKQTMDEIASGDAKAQQSLVDAIRNNRKLGKDTTRLETALKTLTQGIKESGDSANDLYTEGITTKQGIGDAIQLATTVGTIGSLPGMAKNVVTKGTMGAVIKAGAITGAKMGGGVGAVSGFAQGLKQDKSIVDSLKQGVVGGVVGAGTGAVLGGLLSGASKGIGDGLSRYALRPKVVATQVKQGMRPTLAQTITEKSVKNPAFKAMVKEAQKQGFSESDINFLGTISKNDKPIMKKMFDLTVKAQSDPRQITRAGDILGENVTNQVKQVVAMNKQAGKAVDVAAKALRGQEVDVTKLQQKIIGELGDLDIGVSAKGQLDFSQSVFKNVPAIQKQIQKVVLSAPDGSDAYQMHIFKKSIDELVEFGTTGEGLKGRSANLLKAFRNSADDILDTTFDDYNIANTSFKQTRDYIEAAKNLVGKKVDLGSREGSQAFGQALRSAFSNNKSRPNTLKFIEDTHLISKQLGLTGKEKNLLDQALYVDMLEQNFGSEAATGLAGEVSKAINKVQRGVGIIREPISGGLNLVADVIEKARNVSPEAKKQILRAFLQ